MSPSPQTDGTGAVELELTADELAALSTKPTASRPSPPRRAPHLSCAVTASVAAAMTGVVVYLACLPEHRPAVDAPAPAVTVAAAPTVAQPPVAPSPPALKPLRFANPFDPAEVFEFPPGTSRRQAHDAVAQLLMERAQGRIHSRLHGAALAAAGTRTAEARSHVPIIRR